MIRTLVASASPVVRAGLEALLARSASVTVVATSDGDALADDIEAYEPQVVVLAAGAAASGRGERSMGAMAARIALSPDAVSRAPALVLLGDHLTASAAADAIRSGIRAVLRSDATPDEIVAAIEGAAAGLVTVSADLASEIFSSTPAAAVRSTTEQSVALPLTPREIEVLALLAEGLANKQIAARMGISEHTVKTHVASILTKLDAFSRAEAVAIGVRRGLILL